MGEKIRVGIVGVTVGGTAATMRKEGMSFSVAAHMPALAALPEYEVVAVCTTNQASADATAAHFGIPLAFSDVGAFVAHPDVDLVTVAVKVKDHHPLAMAAIEAGKPVYCEWPLGRNSAEATELLDAATRRGVRHVIGLQGRAQPSLNYVRDLVADGYVGAVRSVTMVSGAPRWGARIERAFTADAANGSDPLSIHGGHTLDALCFCLGEFSSLSAVAVAQYAEVFAEDLGHAVPCTSPNQTAIIGRLESGAVVCYQIRGGVRRGVEFLFEIHGEEGDLVLAETARTSMQRQELKVLGARGAGGDLDELEIPARYRWVPESVPSGTPYNVAQMYRWYAEHVTGERPMRPPGFDVAVARHALLDAVVASSLSGERQEFTAS